MEKLSEKVKIDGVEIVEGETLYLDPLCFPQIKVITKEESEKISAESCKEYGIYKVSIAK